MAGYRSRRRRRPEDNPTIHVTYLRSLHRSQLEVALMGWIRWTGKTLEFVGKLAQTESFERWAESQGEKVISDLAIKSGGIVFGMGKEKKAKGIVWTDLETIAEKSPSLNAAIQKFVSDSPGILAAIASH